MLFSVSRTQNKFCLVETYFWAVTVETGRCLGSGKISSLQRTICTTPAWAPLANLISALLSYVIIMKLYVLILLFPVYTNCVIGSNGANYVTAQILKSIWKTLDLNKTLLNVSGQAKGVLAAQNAQLRSKRIHTTRRHLHFPRFKSRHVSSI